MAGIEIVYKRTIADKDIQGAGVIEIDEYTPVTADGDRWGTRSRTEAEASLRTWPVGGSYKDGEPYDGIDHIEKRTVRIEFGEWTQHNPTKKVDEQSEEDSPSPEVR
ncbi:MAG: hypothetical protein ACREMY_05070 [bacterium]